MNLKIIIPFLIISLVFVSGCSEIKEDVGKYLYENLPALGARLTKGLSTCENYCVDQGYDKGRCTFKDEKYVIESLRNYWRNFLEDTSCGAEIKDDPETENPLDAHKLVCQYNKLFIENPSEVGASCAEDRIYICVCFDEEDCGGSDLNKCEKKCTSEGCTG